MSSQDKIERILKEIHVLLAEGQSVGGDPDKVIVSRKDVFAILEKMNLAIYEMMDQYEATAQSRELAERRSEKRGEEMLDRVSNQAEDIYAASLLYTDDALSRMQHLMANALESSQEIWRRLSLELEEEQRRIREDQLELRGQLQDFKDSNKYLVMIEDCNRERERQSKDNKTADKKIQNEARHYAMNVKPEIKVNPAYFERRGLDVPPVQGDVAEEPLKPLGMPEIRVDLDAEYFKWQDKEGKKSEENTEEEDKSLGGSLKKEWKSLFGKK